MAFVKETYSAPTYKDEAPGYGILCNNEVILCNSEKYDCTGSIIMAEEEVTTTTYVKETF